MIGSCFLLESESNIAKELKIKDLINNLNFNDAYISTYDMENTSLNNALEDLNTYSLLSNKKVIIIKGIDKLNNKNTDYDLNESLDNLYKYIENPNTNNLLIITLDKLNHRLNRDKTLIGICTCINVEYNTKDRIKELLDGYKLENGLIDYLIEYLNNDNERIESECLKLKNYKIDEKEITIKDINDICIKEYGDASNITFSLLRSILENNKGESIKKIKLYEKYNQNLLGFISLLDNELRLIYQIKILEDRNYKNIDIMNKLNIKSEYRVKKIKELTRLYNYSDLNKLFIKIKEIDYKSKTTDIDIESLIEDFIINLDK